MLGWRPIMVSWLNTLPKSVNNEMKELISDNFDRLVPCLLNFIRKGGGKVYITIASFLYVFFLSSFMANFLFVISLLCI